VGPDAYWLLVHRPATLVFRTIHFDKAGETGDDRVVQAEIADVAADGTALLVTRGGIPVRVPVAVLFPVHPAGTPPERQSYVGGHELVRNFHPARDEPRATSRWLSRAEVEEVLD